MKRAFTVLAFLFWLLAALAALASVGLMGRPGLLVHQVPAACLLEASDLLGLYIASDSPIVRSAHGAPFLGPVGILLVYAAPAVLFTLLTKAVATRTRR